MSLNILDCSYVSNQYEILKQLQTLYADAISYSTDLCDGNKVETEVCSFSATTITKLKTHVSLVDGEKTTLKSQYPNCDLTS